MPQTPNIPNSQGAFGLNTGADDPGMQYDMPNIQEGVANLYPSNPGFVSTLSRWKTNFVFPGPLKIAVLGDSIPQGFPSGGTTVPFSHRLHQLMFNLHGLADGGMGMMLVSWQGVAGSGVTQTGAPALNGSIGYGVANTARFILAADTFTFNTANATWATGTTVCQTMDVLYCDNSNLNGDIQYKIDGGAVQTLVTAKLGDKLVKSVRIPSGAGPVGLSNAAHSVQILGTGFGVLLVGVVAYAGANGPSGVMVNNAGVGGCTSAQYVSKDPASASIAHDFIRWMQPHLCIIHLGVNDTIQASNLINTTDAISANLNTLIFSILFNGSDVLLVGPPAISPSFVNTFPQANTTLPQLEKVQLTLANTYNAPMLNLRACWGNWGTYLASNMLGDAIIHPNNTGHTDIANRIYRMMMMA